MNETFYRKLALKRHARSTKRKTKRKKFAHFYLFDENPFGVGFRVTYFAKAMLKHLLEKRDALASMHAGWVEPSRRCDMKDKVRIEDPLPPYCHHIATKDIVKTKT